MRRSCGRILLHWLAVGCLVGGTSAAANGAGAPWNSGLKVRAVRDTPPDRTPDRSPDSSRGLRVTSVEYEGWRQYSVQCARCHGQDVLPNPVAANLLVSLAAGGAIDSPEKFAQVVSAGRPHRGMPSFNKTLSGGQIRVVYAYVKGRADKRIPPGRPEKPGG